MPNPNPSPATRFGAPGGNNNRLGGKRKGQRAAELKAAELSAKLRAMALTELTEKVKSGEMQAIEVIQAEILKLFKDSEDRAHGTPKASTELSGPDGGAVPVQAVQWQIVEPNSDDNPSEGR